MAIEFVRDFNFLGIKIVTNLNWLSHTNFLANTIRKPAGVLNKLRDILPQCVLTAIYFSLIQCHFNYAILAWGHQRNRLFKLEKRILRTITYSPYCAVVQKAWQIEGKSYLHTSAIKLNFTINYYTYNCLIISIKCHILCDKYAKPLDRASSNLHIKNYYAE